jgi:hypothetical protein
MTKKISFNNFTIFFLSFLINKKRRRRRKLISSKIEIRLKPVGQIFPCWKKKRMFVEEKKEKKKGKCGG